MTAKAGDSVKITTKEDSFEGILIPRPEMLSQDITVLKLNTGYNIGIETKKIKKIEVIETYKKPEIKKREIKTKKDLPTVAILSTGGTISSRVDYRTGGVYADYTAEDFAAMCPELQEIANIKTAKVMNKMSEDLSPEDWEEVAKAVAKEIEKADGIVITHGTDTMHFTAAALSFILKGLNKPVIITGAQRSIDRGSSDAFMNLTCAVRAAAEWKGAEVAICMHATISDNYCYILKGTKVRKMHTSRRDAFRAINYEPLARVFPEGKLEEINTNHATRKEGKVTLEKLEKNARLIHVYPGINPAVVEKQLEGAKGAVIAGTALGHVPTSGYSDLMPVLEKTAKKIPLFICTQTLYGRVHPYVYTNLRKLSMGLGATYLGDILPETAFAKLTVALKQKNPAEYMKENIAGEFTERELEKTYLQ